jgi:hypothetical protein
VHGRIRLRLVTSCKALRQIVQENMNWEDICPWRITELRAKIRGFFGFILTPQVIDSTHSLFISFACPKSDDFGRGSADLLARGNIRLFRIRIWEEHTASRPAFQAVTSTNSRLFGKLHRQTIFSKRVTELVPLRNSINCGNEAPDGVSLCSPRHQLKCCRNVFWFFVNREKENLCT